MDEKLDEEWATIASTRAEKKAEEDMAIRNQLLSKKLLLERYQKEIEEEFRTHRKEQNHGAEALARSLEELQNESPELFTEVAIAGINRLSRLSEIISADEDGFSTHLQQGGTIQELAQVDNKTMDVLYLGAKRLFDLDLFDDAACAFSFLVGLNPKKYLSTLGLAYSEYRRKHYKEAIDAFLLVTEANQKDPSPLIAMGLCYEQTGQLEKALSSLDQALIASEGKQEHAHLANIIRQEKARLMQ